MLVSRLWMSYAGPKITLGTLRVINYTDPLWASRAPITIAGRAAGKSPSMYGGNIIEFKGQFLQPATGNYSHCVITYGPPEDQFRYRCNTTYIFNNTVQCRLAAGSGTNLYLTVQEALAPLGAAARLC